MYDIPKELPLLIGPRGIAAIEEVTHQAIRSRIKRGTIPAVTFDRHTKRVPTTHMLDVWDIDPAEHRARVAALPSKLPVRQACWEVAMPPWQFSDFLSHLIDDEGMVTTQDLIDLTNIAA